MESTTAPATSTLAVAPDVVVDSTSASPSLKVMDLTGHVVGTVSKSGVDVAAYGVGPHHVWVTNHNALIFYGASGARLATDSYSDANFSSGPVFTADGSKWAWAWSPQQNQQSGGTTTIYLGTQASQMRAVTTHADRLGQRLTPIAWTPDGTVYLTESTVIGGGRIVFSDPATAWSLNPTTGVLSELSATCHLQDVLPDGSLLCLQGSTLTVVRPPTTISTLPVPAGWEQYGDARYSARSIGVLVSAISFQPSTTGATYLTTAGGGSAEQVSGDVFGAFFLPDGRLLERRSSGWVVATSGGTTSGPILPADSTVVGVIDSPQG